MDDLIKMLMDKAKLDEASAQRAAEEVFSFLKEKLPAPIAAHLETILSGGQLEDEGGLMDKLKGLFGS